MRNTSAELDNAIDNLRDFNSSQFETPLSFIPGRINLTREQREELRDVLGNIGGTVGGRKLGGGSGLDDVRALLQAEESDESDDSGNESEGEGEGEEGEGSESADVSDGSDHADQPRKIVKPRKKTSQDSVSTNTSSGTGTNARRQIRNHPTIAENLKADFLSPIGFVQQATAEAQADASGYFQSSTCD